MLNRWEAKQRSVPTAPRGSGKGMTRKGSRGADEGAGRSAKESSDGQLAGEESMGKNETKETRIETGPSLPSIKLKAKSSDRRPSPLMRRGRGEKQGRRTRRNRKVTTGVAQWTFSGQTVRTGSSRASRKESEVRFTKGAERDCRPSKEQLVGGGSGNVSAVALGEGGKDTQ